ncbi:unnamed protein product, partial [marine sediment metagenome]
MAKKKGKNKYVPKSVLEELSIIKGNIHLPVPNIEAT